MLHQGHNKQVNFVQAPLLEIWNKKMSPAGVELSFFVKVCHLCTGLPCFMPSLYILLDWNETILRTLNCDPILQLQRNLAFLCYLALLPLDPSTGRAQRMSGLNVRFFLKNRKELVVLFVCSSSFVNMLTSGNKRRSPSESMHCDQMCSHYEDWCRWWLNE